MRNHVLAYETTRVNRELWADSFDGEKQKDYFPTVSSQSDYSFGPIELGDPVKRDSFYICQTLYFSKTKLVIDDSILWQNARETEFGNFINGRSVLYDRKSLE